MSEFTVVLAPGAENDIAEALNWYRARSATAADAFRAEVLETIDRLAQAPLTWPANAEGNRKRVVTRFPYAVWFEVVGSTVTVLAIAHHKRRPAYWRK